MVQTENNVQGFEPFRIEIYRDIYFDYTTESLSTTYVSCTCSCGPCSSPIDNLFYYSKPTDPIGAQYDKVRHKSYRYFPDYLDEEINTLSTLANDNTVSNNNINDLNETETEFVETLARTPIQYEDNDKKHNFNNYTNTIDDLYQIDHEDSIYDDQNYINAKLQKKQYSAECQVCSKTATFITGGYVQNFSDLSIQPDPTHSGKQITLKKTFQSGEAQYVQGFIHLNEDLFATFFEEYNTKKKKYSTELQKLINTIQEKQTIFQANSRQIQALQKRINVAKSLLEAQADKLKTFSNQFNTFKAQNKQRNKNSVALKLPYMSPFYTMTAKQYLLMMIALVITMIIIILFYGFYTTTRLVGDVSVQSSQNTTPTTNPFLDNQ